MDVLKEVFRMREWIGAFLLWLLVAIPTIYLWEFIKGIKQYGWRHYFGW